MADQQAQHMKNPWSCDEEEHYQKHGVEGSSSFFVSPRGGGLRLFTRTFLPSSSRPLACIGMIHGYTADISWTFQNTAIRLAQMGFAVFGMDMEGHGRSDGLKGFLPDLDGIASDFIAFFASKKSEAPFKDLPFFLFGESLGGGLCLLIHLMESSKQAKEVDSEISSSSHVNDDDDGKHGLSSSSSSRIAISFDGILLLSPMCKISDSMKPPWPLPQLLNLVASFAPTWPIVATKDHRKLSFRDPAKLEISLRNPNRYSGRPRLRTAAEMVRVTEYLGRRLGDVSIPFIVFHGEKDIVTDPEVSKELFAKARSPDKTLKLYEGMWHALLAGEPDEDVETIYRDIEDWLKERILRSEKITKGSGNNAT